jgi:protein-S-isoprenylcysteine O-methyltransferase Ste14
MKCSPQRAVCWRNPLPSWSKIARRIRVPLGFAAAVAFLLLARPAKLSILIGSAVAVVGLVIRALASGHVRKNEVLTVTGPYAHTRNPLYFGSLVLAAGFVIASRSWWLALFVVAMLFAIYLPVIRSEEEFLRTRFPEFGEYERNVPRLFPRFTPYQSSSNSFHWHLYWKHREYNAAVGAAVLIAILIIKAHWFGT